MRSFAVYIVHLKHYLDHWIAYIIYAVFLFFGVFAAIQSLYDTPGRALDGWHAEKSGIQLPYYRILDKTETDLFTLETQIGNEDFLILPRISGNRIRIFLDDELLTQIGTESLTGILWPVFHWIYIPDRYEGKNVTISVELTGLYDIGIRELPHLVRSEKAVLYRWLTSFVFRDLYWLMLGGILVFSVIVLNYALIDKRLGKSYALIGTGLFLGAVYLFEFIYRETSGSLGEYMMLRKIFLVSGYSGSWLILAGMEYYFRGNFKISRFIAIPVMLGLANVIWPKTPVELKSVVSVSAFTAYFCWLVLFLLSCYMGIRRMILFIGFFMLTLLSALLSLSGFKSHIFIIHIGYIMAAGSVAWTIIQQFRRVHHDFHTAYTKSVLDPLTGAYNRFIIEEIKVEPGDIVILADMNEFKEINDRYGHEEGDRVLIEWVRSVKENIRESDKVIRLGGDEFMILLRGTRPDVISKIKADFQNRLAGVPATFSWGIQVVETNLDDAMRSADSKMYTCKSRNISS